MAIAYKKLFSFPEYVTEFRKFMELDRMRAKLLALASQHLRETNRKYLGTFAYDGNSHLTDIFGSPERWEFDMILGFLSERNLAAGKAAVDVGANLGMLSLRFAQLYPKVYSFEPNPMTFGMLKRNLELYAPNAEVFQCGLSSEAGTFQLSADTDNIGNFAITKGGGPSRHSFEVQTVRMDDVLANRTMKIGLIKIDVEGHEYEVFKGAVGVITKDKPVIVVEDLHSGNGSKSDSIKLLESLGYKTFLEPVLLPKRHRSPRSALLRRGILLVRCLFEERGYGLDECDFASPVGSYSCVIAVPPTT